MVADPTTIQRLVAELQASPHCSTWLARMRGLNPPPNLPEVAWRSLVLNGATPPHTPPHVVLTWSQVEILGAHALRGLMEDDEAGLIDLEVVMVRRGQAVPHGV